MIESPKPNNINMRDQYDYSKRARGPVMDFRQFLTVGMWSTASSLLWGGEGAV